MNTMAQSEIVETHFDSATRSTPEEILASRARIREHKMLSQMLEGFPGLAVILDPNRHIVAVNKKANEFIPETTLDNVIGQRLGEAIHCVYANEFPNGCGTSKHCVECGAARAIKLTRETLETAALEARITVEREVSNEFLDLMVYTNVVQVEGIDYTLLTVKDIADEKRRQMLERIFFHDVLNTASAVHSLAALIKIEKDLDEVKGLSHMLVASSDQLIREIQSQRDLMNAERGELVVQFEPVSLGKLLRAVFDIYAAHDLAQERVFEIQGKIPDVVVETARVQLVRCIGNLVKNALEATDSGQHVRISAECDGVNVLIRVSNQGFIPDEVQQRIFHRSFSTKGESGRGLGTYSVRLLVESYLKGKVSFKSSQETGTEFTIQLPLKFRRAA